MNDIHFATRITTDATGSTYIAACGYAGFNSAMFINGKNVMAAVKNARGEWRVTCEKCQEKIHGCDGGNKA